MKTIVLKRVTIFSAYNFILQYHNRQSRLIFMCMQSSPLGNKKIYTKVSSRGLSALFVSKLHNIKILSAHNTEKIKSFVPYKHLLFTQIFWCFLIQHSVKKPQHIKNIEIKDWILKFWSERNCVMFSTKQS